MTHSLQQQIKDQQQVAQRKRYAQNLAESLMAKLQIPQGRHLIALLGTGMEHSNVEALTIWIQRMLPLIGNGALNSREFLELLAKRLENLFE